MFRGEDGNKVALPRHTMWLMRHVARLRPGQSSVQASCLGTSVGQLPSMACGFPHPTTAAFLAASGDQGSLAATEGKKKARSPHRPAAAVHSLPTQPCSASSWEGPYFLPELNPGLKRSQWSPWPWDSPSPGSRKCSQDGWLSHPYTRGRLSLSLTFLQREHPLCILPQAPSTPCASGKPR